jgi:hypothetical protein
MNTINYMEDLEEEHGRHAKERAIRKKGFWRGFSRTSSGGEQPFFRFSAGSQERGTLTSAG